MSKKILKGLKRITIFPITTNTATEYAAGAGLLIPGAQQLTLDPQTTDWQVHADDEVYEAGSDWNGMNISFQVAELSLEMKKHLEGGDWDEATKEYTYKQTSIAPEIGMSFAALTSDGEYRMVKIFSLRVSRISGEYRTKGESGDSSTPITITAQAMGRKLDGAVKREKDSVGQDLSWLNDLNDTPEI